MKTMNKQKTSKDKTAARVLEIQRMSTEDGPGLRTTVFFKGCSLRCAWCHNPESISPQPQVQWIGTKCIGCETCVHSCPAGALAMVENEIVVDRDLCRGCGKCAEICPSTAMEVMGKDWALDDLVHEVLKDKAYFETSGGGITVSGGEPGLQAEFVRDFLKRMRAAGIETALDTCGMVAEADLDMILPYVCLVLFDMKIADPEEHKIFTGQSNEKILGNLVRTAEYIRSHIYPRDLWIRTPVIPGATATTGNISALGIFIARHLSGVASRWELCAFNNLCRDKYKRLAKSWIFSEQELVPEETMEVLAKAAKNSGVDREIVVWSGATGRNRDERYEK